jgi:tetratricopeptide (TPR) repeat protein
MKTMNLRRCSQILLFPLILLAGLLSPAAAQVKPQSKPIDIDRELEVKLPQNRAQSYYHYSLSKWYEESGDVGTALSEMRKAVKYNEQSSSARIGLATLLMERVGNLQEAMAEAQEAVRLDPKDPDGHWILANIYFKSQNPRNEAANREVIRKAIQELESMREVAPQDERAYFALGTAYLQTGEVDRGIQALEKFQSLVSTTNEGYLTIAKFFEGQGKSEKAIEYLNKAVENNPDSAETLLLLAQLQTKLNKTKESAETYKKILGVTGDNPTVKRQLASALLDAGQYGEAAKAIEDLQKTSPDDKEIQLLLGRAKIGNRQYADAIKIFKALYDDAPDSMEVAFYLGDAYQRSGDSQGAIKIFSDLVTKSQSSEEYKPNQKVFLQRLGAAYNDAGEFEKSVAIYEQMLKQENPPTPETIFLLLNAYRLSRQFDKALTAAKKEYERNPGNADIALVYARTLADAGKSKEGAEVLNKLLQSDPTNVDAYVNLSQVYLQGKKYSDAEKVLRKAEEKNLDNPDRERLKFQLASVYERQKDFDRAESVFKELLKENPKNANVLNYIGYMLADRGVRLQEAVQYVKEALELEPNNPAYLDSLGWAFFKLNDLENAEKYLLQAVGMTKNDPTMYDHLGDLYYKTGDLQKAADYWTKSVRNGTEPDDTAKVKDKLEKLQDNLRKQKRK